LITLAVTVIAGVSGLVGGYQVAIAIAGRVAEIRLEEYANRIMADGEASSAELRTVLAAVSASRDAYCSNAEIGYFRALIFESEYVKDAGRMRDGKIECSAGLGRLERPRAQPEADFVQQDGTEIYTSLSPYRNGDLTTIALKLGESYVVFTPLTRMHLEPAPMHFIETATDSPTQRQRRLLGERVEAGVPLPSADGTERLGDDLYVTRCSIRYFNCVTAYAAIPEIIAANREKVAGCTGLCGLVGVCVGLLLSQLYRRNKSVEQQLRRAIRGDRLDVVYQPVVAPSTGRIVGAEALARWTDEGGTAVGPDVFVRLAEERGFVGEITTLVVRHVLADFGETLRGRPDFRVSINVAAADLADPGFLPMLERALTAAGVAARSLVIEITESSTARRDVAIETIRCLRLRGHSVHIDDFGTGYSSLAYLHELSVDAIKIDRAFTQAIGTGAVTVAILPQILAMAGALKLGVVAEGVETQEQAAYFAAAGLPVALQGWLFGRPVAAGVFRRLLGAERKAAPVQVEGAAQLTANPSHAA